jgi:hypothetical protein
MDPRSAAWFVMALLLLLSVLMMFHLMTIWVGVIVCRDYAEAVIDPAVTVAGAEGIASTCGKLETDLSEAVDKYLSVILSLIGGAAVSGSYASAVAPIPPNRKDEEP